MSVWVLALQGKALAVYRDLDSAEAALNRMRSRCRSNEDLADAMGIKDRDYTIGLFPVQTKENA